MSPATSHNRTVETRPDCPRVLGLRRGAMLVAGLAALLGALLVLYTPQAGAQSPPSNDATLGQWEWRVGSGAIDIDYCWPQNRGNYLNPSPAFAAATTSYFQTVTSGYNYVAVKAKANDSNATIAFSKGNPSTGTPTAVTARTADHGFGNSHRAVNGCPRAHGDQDVAGIKYTNAIAFDQPDTWVNVIVTAEDGTTTKTYTVKFTRGVGVSYSVDNSPPSVYHESLYESRGRRGFLVEEGDAERTITIRTNLTGPAPYAFDVETRVFLSNDQSSTRYGTAEYGDLGSGATKRQIAGGGLHYATFGTMSIAKGATSATVEVTIAPDTDRQTDTFIVNLALDRKGGDTRLVREASHWPQVPVIIRDKDAPNAPRNLTVTPGDQQLQLSWDPPTGSNLPQIGGQPWNWRHYYSRSPNRAITLNGYEVQYKESSASDQRGTPANPTTGWTSAAKHFTYDDDRTWTSSKSPAQVQSETSKGLWTIRNLKPDTNYDVRVRALNRDAKGPWVTATSIRTPRTGNLADRSLDVIGWKATLTAGQTRHTFGIGCLYWADTGTNQVPCGSQTYPEVKQGVLVPNTINFWYGGRTYTVNGLYRIDSHLPWGADPFRDQLQRLDLNLSQSLPNDRDLRLRIGGADGLEFKLSAGSHGGGNYRWDLPGFFWEIGDVTTVELVEVVNPPSDLPASLSKLDDVTAIKLVEAMSASRSSCPTCLTGFGVRELPASEQEETKEPEPELEEETKEPEPEEEAEEPEPEEETKEPEPEPEPEPVPEPEPEPEPALSEFVKQYDVNGNEVIDLIEYAQAGQDWGNKKITLEQFNEVKDAYLEGREDPSQIKKLANQPPTVETAFDDITLVGRGGSQQISTSGRFSDPDGHTITMIEAASSAQNVATVAMAADDSSLTVTGGASGTATITVTAHDGHNGRVSDTFTVKVKAVPTVANPIADVSVAAEQTHSISPSNVFSDADGDALTYSVSSADEDIAAAYMFFGDLLIVTVKPGTVTITLTAQDTDGNQVSDSFTLTVTEPPNTAPTVASALSDVTMVNESGTKQVSLSGVFSDGDGDSLTISAESSKSSVATVSVAADYSSLTVTAKSRGTATITVTASDGEDDVSDTFTVKVKAAPTVASAIADISELKRRASQEISMSGVFSDADGDTLALSVSSSDTQIVGFSTAFEGSPTAVTAVTVTAVGQGTATITITAQDSDGNQVSDAFDVTVPSTDAKQQVAAAPGPVIDLTLTPKNGGVQVSWAAPEVGTAPTRYIVHLKPDGGETGSGKIKRPKATKTKVTFSKLKPGTTYQVWMRAQNAHGKGERMHATITLPTSQPE